MGMFDALMDILNERGVKSFEDLNPLEKETFESLLEVAESREVTTEDLRFYIGKLRRAIEEDLSKPEIAIPVNQEAERKRLFLLARLRNMILIEDVLVSPSQAKKTFESMLAQLKNPGNSPK